MRKKDDCNKKTSNLFLFNVNEKRCLFGCPDYISLTKKLLMARMFFRFSLKIPHRGPKKIQYSLRELVKRKMCGRELHYMTFDPLLKQFIILNNVSIGKTKVWMNGITMGSTCTCMCVRYCWTLFILNAFVHILQTAEVLFINILVSDLLSVIG